MEVKMLHYLWVILPAFAMLGCHSYEEVPYTYLSREDTGESYGVGGGQPNLTLPFPSGKYWLVTRAYNTSSHRDYGFRFGDDTYALDFTRNGCDGYGEPVTPAADGTVIKVTTEGNGDQGYGNSVIVDHGGGYATRYGHFSDNYVEVDEYVTTHDYIGAMGNTGNVSGTACGSHPGTHLHFVFYRNTDDWPESTPPEPMSDVWGMDTWCWYNREGNESCDGDPGNYEANDDYNDNTNNDNGGDDNDDGGYDGGYDDEGELDISYVGISPNDGTAEETTFVWTAVVDSPDAEPWATLRIYNPNDDHTYDFEMELVKDSNPWVFAYRKTLRDSSRYSYWVETSNGDGNDRSSKQYVNVDRSSGNSPYIYYFDWTPSSGRADSTEFEWQVNYFSNYSPNATLHILNPNDAHVYDFEMDRYGSGGLYSAVYEKVLRDPTTYPFWVTVESSVSSQSSSVGTVRVSD